MRVSEAPRDCADVRAALDVALDALADLAAVPCYMSVDPLFQCAENEHGLAGYCHPCRARLALDAAYDALDQPARIVNFQRSAYGAQRGCAAPSGI